MLLLCSCRVPCNYAACSLLVVTAELFSHTLYKMLEKERFYSILLYAVNEQVYENIISL